MLNEVKKAKEKFAWDKLTKTIFQIYNDCSSDKKS